MKAFQIYEYTIFKRVRIENTHALKYCYHFILQTKTFIYYFFHMDQYSKGPVDTTVYIIQNLGGGRLEKLQDLTVGEAALASDKILCHWHNGVGFHSAEYYILLTVPFSDTIILNIVCCLLLDACVATSFFQRYASYFSISDIPRYQMG